MSRGLLSPQGQRVPAPLLPSKAAMGRDAEGHHPTWEGQKWDGASARELPSHILHPEQGQQLRFILQHNLPSVGCTELEPVHPVGQLSLSVPKMLRGCSYSPCVLRVPAQQ